MSTEHQPTEAKTAQPQALSVATGSVSPTTDDAWDALNRRACGLHYVAHKMRAMEKALRELMARCEATQGQAFYDQVKPEWEAAESALTQPNHRIGHDAK